MFRWLGLVIDLPIIFRSVITTGLTIESIIIGSKTNWIGNPINTLPFNLNEATINYLNNINLEKYLEEKENDQLESID